MENFSLNSAKSFLGKHVNLHLKDGGVIVNVQMLRVRKGIGKGNLIEYSPYGKSKAAQIPLHQVAWAEQLSLCMFPPVS
jgi:hypothetical protein